MNATVLKFGGSSFQHPEDFGRVARHLAERLAAGEDKIVAVVSAMSGTTDNLKSVMLGVNKQVKPSNLDAALATGEMLSACLLEAAVSRQGIPVMSLNGYSLGICTNSSFGRASIESVDPDSIIAALKENDIVIATGGQAINQSGRLTFLGRNSSDLTAVVIASMLGERSCEIYSDVPGVYTADPYLVPGARLIPKIGYGTIARMSRYGAKVLHHRAVEHAENYSVTIACKSLTSDGVVSGTIVTGHDNAPSVTLARDAAVLSCGNLAERNKLRVLLDQEDVSAICTEDNRGAGLCILSDVDFALRIVALAGNRAVSVGSRTAVTELDSSTLRIYLEDDYTRAICRAREIHERIYPGTDDEPVASRTAKQRSAHSSLLIGTNDAPKNSQ
ncbi:uridylate kinase [Rhizobium leguminosarum bv. trifolii]|uniref:aspartate kinase n=2 Tax=Rhizobium TaxID=379 RepID=A0A3E1B7L6_RHILT|nr:MULTISPECIES: uridylate kinase [Rhizobium]KPH04572.1 uridylate kinase [Rhizobium acidisoli]QAS81171.1 uridylate kinase [Rhizobium acidisoli]RFB86838.1 uridylate kinase [Rhizobium leguminosarum bv. trifolii]RFB87021.1 uridylate kinase [Rhizobium leguminosarum bv. trifolii]